MKVSRVIKVRQARSQEANHIDTQRLLLCKKSTWQDQRMQAKQSITTEWLLEKLKTSNETKAKKLSWTKSLKANHRESLRLRKINHTSEENLQKVSIAVLWLKSKENCLTHSIIRQ